MNDLLQTVAIILGNSGLVVLLEKIIESKSKTRKTIKALSREKTPKAERAMTDKKPKTIKKLCVLFNF